MLGQELEDVLNKCLREGTISKCWKTSRLVLLPKPGKEPNSPSANRPICLLNEAGKLFERVLMNRIAERLKTIGPNLHEHQYGFRSGRSTIDAISRVTSIAEGAIRQGGVALAVSIDIVNAFNSLPWRTIREGLARHELPSYLRKIIASYLTGRTAEYKEKDGFTRREINRGVPQGSVLGRRPSFGTWGTMRFCTQHSRSGYTCYADDTLLVACGRDWTRTIRLMEVGVAALVKKIANLGLEVAVQKTEAAWFHGLPPNKRPSTSWVAVGGERILVGLSIKYLSVVLDGRLNFEAHFAQLAPRVERVVLSLGCIMPNIGGPREWARRLYAACMERRYGQRRVP